MTSWRLLLVLACAICLPIAGADRRDGNWWRQRTALEKASYLTGLFDGMDLGNSFSYWGQPDYKNNKDTTCAGQAFASYTTMSDHYLKDVTNIQISDGVTKFYEDYRNRTIMNFNAVWLVVNMISGKSDAEMQPLIENYRKSANQ